MKHNAINLKALDRAIKMYVDSNLTVRQVADRLNLNPEQLVKLFTRTEIGKKIQRFRAFRRNPNALTVPSSPNILRCTENYSKLRVGNKCNQKDQ